MTKFLPGKTFLITLTLSAVCLLNVQAQPPASGARGTQAPKVGYGKISGTVVDANNEPVPYAAISLLDQETKKVQDGTVADDKGQFVIRSIAEGNYIVNISFIGYESIDKGPYVITGKGESHDLGTLTLNEKSVQLDEVVIAGERDLVEDKIDRIVYNAEQDKTTVGGDATDVLRRVPLLSVDLDGNVSMRGSSNIKVLIDNRPSTITAGSIADALKQIPADQIKSVEVITSPSARYDAEGTGGIINIITKKNDLQGGSLSINSSAGYRGSNLGLNANYRKGRMGLTLGGFGRAGYNIEGEYSNEQVIKNELGETVSTTFQNAETNTDMMFGRYNLGWDYSINKYNWVSASVNFGVFNFKSTQDNRLTRTFDANSGTRNSLEDIGMDNLSNTVDVSANYIRTFEEKGKEISLLTLYSQNNRVNDFDIETLESDTPMDFDVIRNQNDSYNREFTVQLDYVEPVSDKVIVELGAKNITRDVNSNYQYLTGTDGEFTESPRNALNNNFDYQQNVSSGYLSTKFEFAKGYSAMLGGRYEYTTIDANFDDEQTLDIQDYGVIIPSINLAKKLSQTNTLKFAYSRRIQRPSLQFLNPNIDASNPLNISQGNPNLEPEYTNNFEVSYSTFKNQSSINFSAFMRNTDGSIQQVRETLGQDTIFTTYQNIGEEDAYGVSVFANLRMGKFTLNGGVDTYYAILDNNQEEPLYKASNEGFVVSGRLFGSYEITKQWAFQFFSFMRGRQVQLQGYQTGFYVYSLSLNRKFKDDKGSIGIGAENFLTSSMKMESEIESPLIYQQNTNLMRNMNFKINFSYRIGKLTTGQTRRRNRGVENNDLKDGGSNQNSMINN